MPARLVDAQINDILAEDPDELFFVDLRDGTRYGFDQRVESMPWDNFLIQCPSMTAPMSMPDFVRMLDLDTSPSLWSVQSADADSEGFRAIDERCDFICDHTYTDCFWVC